MGKTATIESEILSVVPRAKRKKGEKEQAFLLRVVKAIAKIDEEQWDELSEEAQDWYDEAAEAANEGDPLPPFPAAAAPDDDEEEEYEDDADEEEEYEDDADEDEDEEYEDDEDEEYEDDEDDEDEEYEDDEDDEDDEDEEYEDEDEDEDDAEEDEDEDEDEPDGEEESLELEDLSRGDYVTAETEDDEFTGKVTGTGRGVLTLEVDGDKVKLKNADLTWISRAEAPETKKAKGRGRKAASNGGAKKKPVGQTINEIIAKFPGLSEDKVAARVEKEGVECSASTLHNYYRQAHAFIDLLKENGWKKGK